MDNRLSVITIAVSSITFLVIGLILIYKTPLISLPPSPAPSSPPTTASPTSTPQPYVADFYLASASAGTIALGFDVKSDPSNLGISALRASLTFDPEKLTITKNDLTSALPAPWKILRQDATSSGTIMIEAVYLRGQAQNQSNLGRHTVMLIKPKILELYSDISVNADQSQFYFVFQNQKVAPATGAMINL